MAKPYEICIPRIDKKILREEIFQTFCRLKIGYIEKLIEIPLKTDENFKRILVKIKLNETEQTEYIKNRLEAGEPVNVVYDMPWFWQLKKATQQK